MEQKNNLSSAHTNPPKNILGHSSQNMCEDYFILPWVVNTVMTRCMHVHWQGSTGYLAFYGKPLCRISASCWMQVGCETYLLQPRCGCNPSLSPLPPPCSGGCLEHRPQVCPRQCMWPLACMFVCLSLFFFNCKCESFLWCIYCIFTCIHMCTVLLFLSPSPLCSSFSYCLQAGVLYNINFSH